MLAGCRQARICRFVHLCCSFAVCFAAVAAQNLMGRFCWRLYGAIKMCSTGTCTVTILWRSSKKAWCLCRTCGTHCWLTANGNHVDRRSSSCNNMKVWNFCDCEVVRQAACNCYQHLLYPHMYCTHAATHVTLLQPSWKSAAARSPVQAVHEQPMHLHLGNTLQV